MSIALIGFAAFLFLLAAVGVSSGVAHMFGDSEDSGREVWVVIGTIWVFSGLLFAAAGALLLRRRPELTTRTIAILAAALVVAAVVLTVSPVLGAPLAALATLAAVARFAR